MLIGLGVWCFAESLAGARRVVLGAGTGLVLAAGVLHSVMIANLLGYVGSHFDPEYGAPLARTEHLAAAVGQLGQGAASQDVFVEFRTPESGATAYVLRDWFPSIELAQVGQIGFGPRMTPRAARTDQPAPLGALSAAALAYADGVSVDDTALQTSWQRGEPVRVLVVWTYDPRGALATRAITWDLALHAPGGEQVRHQSGLQHAPDETPTGRALVSWFALETDTGLAPGQYELRLRRVDDANRAVPFVDGTGQPGTEWRLMLPELARPAG
jgi:hypothetical protein